MSTQFKSSTGKSDFTKKYFVSLSGTNKIRSVTFRFVLFAPSVPVAHALAMKIAKDWCQYAYRESFDPSAFFISPVPPWGLATITEEVTRFFDQEFCIAFYLGATAISSEAFNNYLTHDQFQPEKLLSA